MKQKFLMVVALGVLFAANGAMADGGYDDTEAPPSLEVMTCDPHVENCDVSASDAEVSTEPEMVRTKIGSGIEGN